MKKIILFLIIAFLICLLAACSKTAETFKTENAESMPQSSLNTESSSDESDRQKETEDMTKQLSNTGRIPDVLEEIPDEYYSPADHAGSLNKLSYQTWESFSYDEHSQALTKEAWVYLPYGYSEGQQYNIFYLSHGGWSNETTIMGTADNPNSFKNVIDHAIEDGKITPMIFVMLTYNNTDGQDSWDYSLAIKLTDQFHNELVNDLIPAVESKYNTFAENTTIDGIRASRDHRGFGGFSMGSVNTWCTFRYAMDCFRYFMPMSGNYTTDGRYMADLVREQGFGPEDFFLFAMSGPDDFAYSSFKRQIDAMGKVTSMFVYGNTENKGNLAFREMAGYTHGPEASNLYTYNGLQFFFKGETATDEKRTDDTPEQIVYTKDTLITEVQNDPMLGDWGGLLFPANTGYMSGSTLGNLRLTWYSNIDPDKTVEIANYMRTRAAAGETVFYDIYTDEEKVADPAKKDTGLFFFRGDPGAKFAICNAGGGFAYVGAMHDSFPHALELSKMGYNAFALIYRPGWDTACEDLARAISFIFKNAEELQVDTDCYSLWGGSAGARMAAYLGTYGPAYFGGDDLPRPGTVVMQYTGHNEYSEQDPPTYACCGTSDGIASWRTMQSRLNAMSSLGIPTEFHSYQGLSHGFGLGTGTVAEGWINDAVAFWEAQME